MGGVSSMLRTHYPVGHIMGTVWCHPHPGPNNGHDHGAYCRAILHYVGFGKVDNDRTAHPSRAWCRLSALPCFRIIRQTAAATGTACVPRMRQVYHLSSQMTKMTTGSCRVSLVCSRTPLPIDAASVFSHLTVPNGPMTNVHVSWRQRST